MQFDSIALIDNDFLIHMVEMKRDDVTAIEIISRVFDELNLIPAVHPLVLEKEVQIDNAKIKRLIEDEIVKSPSFEDIHKNQNDKKAYYCYVVQELYKKLNGEPLELGDETVFTFWKRQQSLGEIHSLSACVICDCGIFLSDDNDSLKLRDIISNFFAFNIKVHNRQDVVALLRKNKTRIRRSELRSFSHSR